MRTLHTNTEVAVRIHGWLICSVLLAHSAIASDVVADFTLYSHAGSGYDDSPASAVYGGYRHIFRVEYSSSTISVLSWCKTTTTSCTWEYIDGLSSNLYITSPITSIVWNSKLHLFYGNAYAGDNDLKHASYDGSTWSIETLDGDGGSSGRTSDAVVLNGSIGAASINNGTNWLFISFYNGASGDLRIGYYSGTGDWEFQNWDGGGGANGRISSDVGFQSVLFSGSGYLHAFYSDSDNGDLRHAWWGGSGDWSFVTHDGDSSSGGRTTNNVGYFTGGIAAMIHGGYAHVYYTDATSKDARHTYSSNGTGAWGYRTALSSGDWLTQANTIVSDGTTVSVFLRKTSSDELWQLWGSGSGTWYENNLHSVTMNTWSGAQLYDGKVGVVFRDGDRIKLGLNDP